MYFPRVLHITRLFALCIIKQSEEEAAADGFFDILQLVLRLGHDLLDARYLQWVRVIAPSVVSCRGSKAYHEIFSLVKQCSSQAEAHPG